MKKLKNDMSKSVSQKRNTLRIQGRTQWLLALMLAVALLGSACGQTAPVQTEVAATPEAQVETTPAASELSETETVTDPPSEEPQAETVPVPSQDRAGNDIVVPEKVERIISMAPSFTETLIAMGLGDRIVAIELNSVNLEGVDPSWPVFDMMAPDAEQMLQLEPDLILASGMSMGGGEDPFKPLQDAGICVAYVPSSNSIAGIVEDLLFLGAITGASKESEALVADMQKAIDEIAEIGSTVTEQKSVYFEIGAAPYIYSFGTGVFLDEMIRIIGAVNVFAEHESWMSVSEEVAISADPDVILTNVSYIPDSVGEIMGREGWSELRAIAEEQVFYIDNMSSSLPNQGIVKALYEMAKAVYPDLY